MISISENLLPITRVLSLQRDEARIEGEVGTLMAQIAKLRGQIAETRLQIIAIDENRFSDAQKELRDVEGRIAELQEGKIAAEDQLRRVELRAPIDGVIHELSVHTVGGVVNPAEQLMLIVPSRRFTVCRGSHPDIGYRPAEARAARQIALYSLQPAYDAGGERDHDARFARTSSTTRRPGSPTTSLALRPTPETSPARRQEARSWDAG